MCTNWKYIFFIFNMTDCIRPSINYSHLVERERQVFNLNVEGSSPCSGDILFYQYLLLNPKYTWAWKIFINIFLNIGRVQMFKIYHPLFPDDMQYLSFKRLREFGWKCSDYLLINKTFCLSAWWLKISHLFVYYFSNTRFLSCSWKCIPTTFLTLSSLN